MLQNVNNQIERIIKPIQSLYQTANKWYQTELVQNIIGIAQLILGTIAAYHLYQDYLKSRALRQNPTNKSHSLTWQQKFIQYIPTLGHLSYICNALTSRHIVTAWKWSINLISTNQKMEHLLKQGPLDYAFSIYQIIYLSSWILSLPSIIQTVYECNIWLSHKIRYYSSSQSKWADTIQKINLSETINSLTKRSLLI